MDQSPKQSNETVGRSPLFTHATYRPPFVQRSSRFIEIDQYSISFGLRPTMGVHVGRERERERESVRICSALNWNGSCELLLLLLLLRGAQSDSFLRA
jgi:hypothetical protein